MTLTFFSSRNFLFHFSLASLLLFAFVKSNDGLNDEVLKYTNEFRKSKGMAALVMRDDLNAIAQVHSDEMAKGQKSFGHDGFNQRESEVQKIIKPFTSMAENVAYGATNGKEVVDMWKDSPGHRANMLGDYKYLGIGTARDDKGIIYFTAIFVK